MPPNAPVWPAQTGSTANVLPAKRATGELRLVRKLLFPVQKLRLLAVSATGVQTALPLLLCAREERKTENGATPCNLPITKLVLDLNLGGPSCVAYPMRFEPSAAK